MFTRSLNLPLKESFFLWGPRQSGKSTLLHALYPKALWLDLLKADEFRRFLHHPELLREEAANASFVVIDEVQKVPQLLDEVHWLIENKGIHFALCGSSARKVKRGHANLLGGRALRFELFGLTAHELGKDFDLTRLLNHGFLPPHYIREKPELALRSYVADYLKEEVAAEGLVRNLPNFSEFLNIASFSDAELVNFATIARDVGTSGHTIKSYFEILEDTLLGRWLSAYRKRPKRRVIESSKFYFFDVGVVNFLAKRRMIEPGTEAFGKAFENWLFHELSAYNAYSLKYEDLFYWRLASGIEVDFIIGNMRAAIEAKASRKITSDHLKGLRSIQEDHPEIEKRIVVSLESRKRRTEDGIEILPVKDFIKQLWLGEIF